MTPPAITEIGSGWYAFEITPVAPLVGVVNGGSTLSNADRYKSVSVPVSAATAFGSAEVVIELRDAVTSLAIPDVEVVIMNEDETLLVNSGATNSIGEITVQLNPGDYVARFRKDGYNFTVPQPFTVVGDVGFIYAGTQVGDVAADFRSIVVPRSPILTHEV